MVLGCLKFREWITPIYCFELTVEYKRRHCFVAKGPGVEETHRKSSGESSRLGRWCWGVSLSSLQILTSGVYTLCLYPGNFETVHVSFTSCKGSRGCFSRCRKGSFLMDTQISQPAISLTPNHRNRGSLTDVRMLESKATRTEVLNTHWEIRTGLGRGGQVPRSLGLTLRPQTLVFLCKELAKDIWLPTPTPPTQ